MYENAFESPSISNESPPPRSREGKRPLLLGLIAAFHLIWGVLGFAAMAYATARLALRGPAAAASATYLMLLLALLLQHLLNLAVFVGIWWRLAWGWRLTVFAYCLPLSFLILGVAGSLAPPAAAAFGFPQMMRTTTVIVTVWLLVCGLLLAYLFTPRVVEYFRIQEMNRGKALGVLAAAAFVVCLAPPALMTLQAVLQIAR